MKKQFPIYYYIFSAIIYFGGETIQMFYAIPSWIRYHLSDIGFVLWYSCTFSIYNMILGLRLKTKYYILLAIISAILYELFQFYNGKGDYLDILCYVIGGLIGFIFIKSKKCKNRIKR